MAVRVRCFLLLVLSAGVLGQFPLFSQDTPSGQAVPGRIDTGEYLLLTAWDIATADLYQLENWCRILNLDYHGTVDALRRRLYAYFEIESADQPAGTAAETRRISIKSADSTRYFTLEEREEGYIEITGGIVLELESPQDGNVHKIEADRLLYNQASGDLSAYGNVRYLLTEGETQKETFYGESLTVNIEDWESRFLKGYTLQDRTVNEKELTFSFYGDTIARSSSEIIYMQEGRITSSEMVPPSYQIKADEIWVYEPGEWLLDGATFYIGRVPVLMFPFFFQLRDSMIVNPSVGFDLEKGAFMQTTTYFYGESSAMEEDSLSFLQMTSVEDTDRVTEWRGLYNRTRDNPTEEELEAARKRNSRGDYFRLLMDYYSRTGLVSALDLSIGSTAWFDSLHLFGGVGFTRVVADYAPYTYTWQDPDDGELLSVWEGSWVGGMYLPVRLNLSAGVETTMDRFKLNLELPFISDPLIEDLYENRSESIDWGKLLALTEEDSTTSSSSLPTGFSWDLSTSWTADTSALSPWVTAFSIKNFSSSLDWVYGKMTSGALTSAEIEELLPHYDAVSGSYASIYFPYAKTLVLPEITLSLQGTLYPWGKEGKTAEKTAEEDLDLIPPWTEQLENPESAEADEDSSIYVPDRLDDFTFSLDGDTGAEPSLTYQFTPYINHGYTFDIYGWDNSWNDWSLADPDVVSYPSPEDVSFDTAYSLTTLSGDARLNFSSDFSNRVWSLEESLSFTYQEKIRQLTIDSAIPDPEEESWNDLLESDKEASYERLSHSLTLTARPFVNSAVPVDQVIEYRLQHYLYSREYDSDDGLQTQVLPWERSTLQQQKVTSTTGFDPGGYDQTVVLSVILPPLLGDINGSYTGDFGSFDFYAAGEIEEVDDNNWKPQESTLLGKYSFADRIYLSQEFIFDEDDGSDFRLREGESIFSAAVKDNTLGSKADFAYLLDYSDDQGDYYPLQPDSLVLSGWAGGFTASYSMEYTEPYSLELPGSGWVKAAYPEFIPSEVTMSYKKNYTPDPMWKRRVNLDFSIESGLTQDLNKFSDSSFFFETGLDFSVYKFLDLSFSFSSENTAIFRYLPWLLKGTGIEPLNPLDDLVKSFNFFDNEERRLSNFNLQSIDLKAVHHLDQWDLTLEYTGLPELDSTGSQSRYVWESTFSIYVQWNPIPELEQSVDYSDGDFSF